jgi:hypothetical protein
MGMKFLAVAGDLPGLRGGGLEWYRNKVRNDAAANGYSGIDNYNSITNLFSSIQGRLDADNFNCLEELVIVAHGSPGTSNGITAANALAFATGLKAIRLCDEVDLYLNSCNTAINTRGNYCIAQIISAAGPTRANDMVQLTVYGSVGYLRGIRMNGHGNERTTGDRITAGIHGASFPAGFPDAPDASGNPGVSIGSHNAVGNAVWRAYREGRRIQ